MISGHTYDEDKIDLLISTFYSINMMSWYSYWYHYQYDMVIGFKITERWSFTKQQIE